VYAADAENILAFEHEHFSVADMSERLPFADEMFDAVVCIDGIEHIARPFDFIRECARVLRPGGSLIISTPNLMSLRSRWRFLLTGFHQGEKVPLDESDPNPLHHITLVTFADLRYRLHTAGFRVVTVETNRQRLIAKLYAFLLPFAWAMTLWVFYKEGRRRTTGEQNAEIRQQLFSQKVLFGETLIVKAVRDEK
jgi:SAM-dependent methyltransferase